VRILSGTLVLMLFVAGAVCGAQAQVIPAGSGATPATVPAELYVPLRVAFLATLRANSPTDASFAYASALQKAQAGDILGAQREAGRAMLLSPGLPPSLLQPLKSAISLAADFIDIGRAHYDRARSRRSASAAPR
jgi:hypothetical protein